MPLDTGTKAFLDMLQASGGKPLYEQTISDARASLAALRLGGTPEEMHLVVDRQIPSVGGEVGVRLYSPRALAAGASLPIVMHYHGGGFVVGDLDTHDFLARYYAKHADAIVVSVNYRLAPEHKFPAGAEDCYAALCWAVAHARELKADPDRVAVTGDSSGGNLSAVMCQLAKTRKGPRIAFQALVYPVTDLDPAADFSSRRQFGGGEYFLSTRDMDWFTSLYLSDVANECKDLRASPLRAQDLAGLPPALVITAGFDLLRDEGKAYADRLVSAGVPVEYRCFEGTIHAFASFSGVIPVGQEALSLVAARLRTALHGA